MKESKEIKELRSKIIGMEMELSLISKDLERFKKELTYYQKMLEKINENIKFLKNSKATVSLSEYRKIKYQQKITEMRVKYFTKKVLPIEQSLNKKEMYHKEEMERFHKMYKLQFVNNILEFPNDRRKKTKN